MAHSRLVAYIISPPTTAKEVSRLRFACLKAAASATLSGRK
jgi:hypothetical protein